MSHESFGLKDYVPRKPAPHQLVKDCGYDSFCMRCLKRFGGGAHLIGQERYLNAIKCEVCAKKERPANYRRCKGEI